jgi:tetratricopeptide (TPR) repeat protein
MPKRVQHEAFQLLVQDSRWQAALEILEIGLNNVRAQHDWNIWRGAIAHVPVAILLDSIRYCRCHARILRGCRDATAVSKFVTLALGKHTGDPQLRVEHAWALSFDDQYLEASQELEKVIPDCQSSTLGLAFRVLAQCEHALGRDPKPSFEHARQHLHGRELGLCLLEQASTLGDTNDTRLLYAQANALLEHDPYHRAWLNHNWGMYELRTGGVEAEARLLEAVRLTRSAAAEEFRPRALCGLAAFHRYNHELERAETGYKSALRQAHEIDDREQALWGLAQTLRIAGRFGEALEHLEAASLLRASAWLKPSIAATLINIDNLELARVHLESQIWQGVTSQRATIAQAELARRDQNHSRVIELLHGMNWQSPATNEELSSFPKLHALAIALELPVPAKPLQTVTRVLVKTLGSLEIHVNDRRVAINPTGRIAEVLAYLLEHGHTATCRDLALALWPDLSPTEMHRKAKTVNEHVRGLRRVLGWQSSVLSRGSTYSLDPNAVWAHDATALKHQARERYQHHLNGIHSNWAISTEQDLNALLNELPQVEREALKQKPFGSSLDVGKSG